MKSTHSTERTTVQKDEGITKEEKNQTNENKIEI